MPGLIVGVGSVIQQQAYNLPMLAVRCTQQRIIAIIVLPILVHVFMQKVAHDLGMAFRRGSIQGAIVRTSEQHAFLFAGAKMCACSHQQLDGRQMPLFGGIDERGAVFPFRIGGDARVKQTPNLDIVSLCCRAEQHVLRGCCSHGLHRSNAEDSKYATGC